MENLAPLGDNVIVKPLAQETVTKGGIIIPDTAKEKPQQGEIIATGPGRTNKKGAVVPMNVKVGDQIIFAKYTGSEIKLDNEKYVIMPESDALAVLVDESATASARSEAKGKKNG